MSNFFRNEIQIPEGWDYPKFNQIVKTNPYTKIEEKRVPYIPMDAVDTEKPHFNYSEERELSDNPSLSKFQNNDILFARITPSTENGKTCIVENFEHKGIVSSELTVLRTTENIIPKYLYYYVKSHRIRQFAISQMLGTTGRQRVPDYVFKKDLNIELPPLQEQQKITLILSNVDSLIGSTSKVIENSKQVKTGLMQKLLTRGIGHTKFKKVPWLFGNEIEIPEEWDVKRLDEIGEIIGGGTPDSTNKDYWDGEILWAVPTDITKLQINQIENTERKITQQGLDNSSAKMLPEESILITSRATVGECAITTKPISTNQGFQNIVCNDRHHNYLIFYLIKQFPNNLLRLSHGTTFLEISKNQIKKVIIPVSNSLPEQQKIASILSNIDSKIDSQVQYKEKLLLLKKSLMQKLLTGEVRV